MWLRLKPDCLSSDCLYMQPNKKAMYNAKNKKKKIDRLAPQSVLQHVLANRSFSYLQYLKVSWINLAIVQLIKIDHLYSISLSSFHEMPIWLFVYSIYNLYLTVINLPITLYICVFIVCIVPRRISNMYLVETLSYIISCCIFYSLWHHETIFWLLTINCIKYKLILVSL